MVVMSPYVLWPIPSDSALRRYFWNWGLCGHCADCRNVRLRPRHALLTGGDPRNSSGSLTILAAMRRALLRRNEAQTMLRTAFSTPVREAGDLSAGVFDRQARNKVARQLNERPRRLCDLQPQPNDLMLVLHRPLSRHFNAGQTTDVAARSPFYAMKAQLENTGRAPARYHARHPAP